MAVFKKTKKRAAVGRGKDFTALKVAAAVVVFLFIFPLVFRLLPFPALQEFMAQEYSCRIYDRRGELIQVTALNGGGRREFTPIKEIPIEIQHAFLAQEDRRFYSHHGVDWLAIMRASIQNRKAGRIVRGGSTITMQLAKLINQDNSLTLSRKLKDVFYAYRIEAKLSKKKDSGALPEFHLFRRKLLWNYLGSPQLFWLPAFSANSRPDSSTFRNSKKSFFLQSGNFKGTFFRFFKRD
jgi:penicillin-binding protein 1C